MWLLYNWVIFARLIIQFNRDRVLPLALLKTREGVPDVKTALDWNFREHHGEESLDKNQSLGSWCLSETGLTYTSFFPNSMFTKGAIGNIGLWMMVRLRQLHQDQNDHIN